ncbi:MAG: LysM domain-containing protein [Candidatus Adiutrix sp.]|jgi:hypothetical protein|nr:LysM domain-containing protein [Candidatus Adiutrix sp.]
MISSNFKRLSLALVLFCWPLSAVFLAAQDNRPPAPRAAEERPDEDKTAVPIPKPGDSGEEGFSPPAPGAGESRATADHTITLSKVVEVFEFENLKVAVDQYQVQRGDSLSRLMRKRGLLKPGGDEGQLMRLVRSLNPDLRDLNRLEVGRVLNLPVLPDQSAEVAPAAAASPENKAARAGAPWPAGPQLVKSYERPQSSQKSAEIRVMRDRSLAPPDLVQSVPAAPEVAGDPSRPASAGEPEGSGPPAPAGPAPAAGPLDFPSGNAGPLARAEGSGVVYRSVRLRRGDTLERLLRREGLPRDVIYGHLLKVTLELNPEIKDPNLIFAGAEIKIPAAGDYLAALAGLNPEEVKSAAADIARGRRPSGGPGAGAGRARAEVLELPDEAVLSAQSSLGLIFTRLGGRVESLGRVLLPAESAGLQLDTSAFPLAELPGGRRLVLDLGSRLPQAAVRSLRGQGYQVFRSGPRESLDRALSRLWPLCGFYRVYGRDRSYEGGSDIRLKIFADWMVWTSEEAWNSGQPLVLNRVSRSGRRSDPAWTRFLADHGIQLLDIQQNSLLPEPEKIPPAELRLVNLDDRNPALFAAELVRALGAEPKVGVQLDLARGRSEEPDVEGRLTAPVLWPSGGAEVVLHFGELPAEAVLTLKRNGYRVVLSPRDSEGVVEAVLSGFGFKVGRGLTINAPAGGPEMSLSIKGRLVDTGRGRRLITPAALPSGLGALLEPDLTVLKY